MSQEPHFLIVGQMKCGTTSLYGSLCSSAAFLPVDKKELHFFSVDKKYDKGISAYLDQFPTCCVGQITVEASPSYFGAPQAAPRIARHLPHVKLIICLRHPGRRAVSHYHHEVRYGRESRSFGEAFDVSGDVWSNGYITQSTYAPSIAWYLNFFPPQQFCVFVLESYIKSPQQTMSTVFSFLGLDVPQAMEAHKLSSAAPEAYDESHLEVIGRVARHCQESQGALPGMIRRNNIAVAGNLSDMTDSSGTAD